MLGFILLFWNELLAGSLLLLLLHLLPLAESSRSGGSRSHNFAPRFSAVETVSSYAFARKIRHPCGLSVVKRSISSEMAEQQQHHQQQHQQHQHQHQQSSSSTTSLLIKLINLFTKSIGSSQEEGKRLTTTGDLREGKKSNSNSTSSSSFKAQLAKLRALKSKPIRRNDNSNMANLEMRRNLLEAISRLASEVADTIPMTVSWGIWSNNSWKYVIVLKMIFL